MLHQPGLSLVRKTSAAHVSLSSIFDCQRTERKPSQPMHQNKQVPAPLRVKTRKPSVSGDGDSERRRCFPAPPSLLMGLYAPPPRTVKPPPQKKSNQPKKLTQPTHHPWGKPTQQHNKTKQNQHSNNMHRQTKEQQGGAWPTASRGLQGREYEDSCPFPSSQRRRPGPFSAVLPPPPIYARPLAHRFASRGHADGIPDAADLLPDLRGVRIFLNAGDTVPTSKSFSNTRGV